MSFLLTLTDFSTGEGIYTTEQIARLAPRLGYTDLVLWDRGLHGYPKLRDELELQKSPARLHLGSRFSWGGHNYGALPCTNRGYGELNHLLTDQAHNREGRLPRWRSR